MSVLLRCSLLVLGAGTPQMSVRQTPGTPQIGVLGGGGGGAGANGRLRGGGGANGRSPPELRAPELRAPALRERLRTPNQSTGDVEESDIARM